MPHTDDQAIEMNGQPPRTYPSRHNSGAMAKIDGLFLSEAEIVSLTGATQPAAQERIIIQELGLYAYRNRNNEVKLAREAQIRKQLGASAQTTAAAEPELMLGG